MKRPMMKTMMWLAIALTLHLPAETDSYDALIERQYAYSNWCGRTRRVYPRLVRDWTIPALSLPTNGTDAVVEVEKRSSDEDFEVFCISLDDRQRFLIGSSVCADVEDAHAAIMWRFANSQSTAILPQVTNDIGDVLFYYKSRLSVGDYTIFARNNVCVWVDSYDGACSATNIAKEIDADILRASGVGP